ncbi:MAG: TetR family transcriptional regulator [Stackebrandtia sp.]
MATRGETRARILAAAGELFERQGFHATGMNQILAAGDAPKGSLYFHFPGGKEQLAAEAVAAAAASSALRFDAFIEEARDPADMARQVAGHLGRRLVETDFRRGCPVTAVALDACDLESVRRSCAGGYQSWIERFAAALRDAGAAPVDAEELAVLAVSALEGALVLARVRRDVAPLKSTGERLAALVAASLPTQTRST